MSKNKNTSLLEDVRKIVLTYKNTVGSGTSLPEVASLSTVRPITLVSSSLMGVKDLTNIQYGILNFYAGYYLMVVGLLSVQLVDVNILKMLDKVNPNRDLNSLMTTVGLESFVQEVSEEKLAENVRRYLAMEGLEFGLTSEYGKQIAKNGYPEVSTESSGLTTRQVDSFEKQDATIGKLLELKIAVGTDGQQVTIPVSINLDVMYIPSEVVSSMVTINKESIRLGARFKDAITGRIGFIKDFLLASDLIQKQKKMLIKDPTRAYDSVLSSIENNKLYGVLSANPSLSTISAIMMISEEEENEIRKEIGGDLTNEKTRNIVFDNTSAAIIAVVDRDWSNVRIFIRGMKNYSTIPFASFKGSSNDKGSDVLIEMVRSMSSGRMVSF